MSAIKFLPDLGSGARRDDDYHYICPINIRITGRRGSFFVADARAYTPIDAAAKAAAVGQVIADMLNASVTANGDFRGPMLDFVELFRADNAIAEQVYLNRCEPDLRRLLEKLVTERRGKLTIQHGKPVLRMTVAEIEKVCEELDAVEDEPSSIIH